MKNKKLLVLCIIFGAVLVVTMITSSVTAVSNCFVSTYSEQGGEIVGSENLPDADEILENYRGKNIIFLSKSEALKELNERYPQWYFIDIVKHFPNTIEICITERIALFTFEVSNTTYYVDYLGYLVSEEDAIDNTNLIDITSVFAGASLSNATVGEPLVFRLPENNQKLTFVLETVASIWRVKYDFSDIGELVTGFSFAKNTLDNSKWDMTIYTNQIGAKIIVEDASYDLESRLIKAISVYNAKDNKLGAEITVTPNGDVTSK